MSHDYIIETEDLWRTYGKGELQVHALRGVSVRIAQGDFVAIMGPSGSGKTTLMNILGCLDRPTRGRYRLLGYQVGSLTRDQLADVRNLVLGFVFQNYSLLPRTSALDNVQLPLMYAGVPRRERRERAAEALERVGLADRLSHHPNELSGGQQQRVAIARALVTQPRVILADEPTGNLDTKTSLEIVSTFQDLRAEGITVVYVTHELEVAQFATHVLTIRDGVVADMRTQQPKSARAALADLPQAA